MCIRPDITVSSTNTRNKKDIDYEFLCKQTVVMCGPIALIPCPVWVTLASCQLIEHWIYFLWSRGLSNRHRSRAECSASIFAAEKNLRIRICRCVCICIWYMFMYVYMYVYMNVCWMWIWMCACICIHCRLLKTKHSKPPLLYCLYFPLKHLNTTPAFYNRVLLPPAVRNIQ